MHTLTGNDAATLTPSVRQHPGSAVLLCLGIHGQMVHVSTAANMVDAKLSSWPVPQDPVMLSAKLRAFDAITRHLAASGTQAGQLPRPDRGDPHRSWHQPGALGDEHTEDRGTRSRSRGADSVQRGPEPAR